MSKQLKLHKPLPAKTAYNLAANFYDRRLWMKFWELNEKPIVVGLLGMPRKKRILDIGCGTGFYSMDLIRRGNEVCGVDCASRMIAQFRGKMSGLPAVSRKRIEFLRGDAENLVLGRRVFDACLIVRTLSHIKNTGKLFAEIHRVLRPKGVMVIADLHHKHSYKYTVLKDPHSKRRIPVITYKRDLRDYEKNLKKLGFKKESYKEPAYRNLRWQPRRDDEFKSIMANSARPVFFVARFSKVK